MLQISSLSILSGYVYSYGVSMLSDDGDRPEGVDGAIDMFIDGRDDIITKYDVKNQQYTTICVISTCTCNVPLL